MLAIRCIVLKLARELSHFRLLNSGSTLTVRFVRKYWPYLTVYQATFQKL